MLPSSRTRLGLTVAGTLLAGVLAPLTPLAPLTGPSSAEAATASALTGVAAGCADRLLDRPQPAADAVADLSGAEQRQVAALNDLTTSRLDAVVGDGPAGDDALWLDRCGRSFYVDPAQPAAADVAPAAASAAAVSAAAAADGATGPAGPLADTFDLQSDPSSKHTIYLDFTGQSVSGTAWNDPAYGTTAGGTITAPPYSLDGKVDTSFSAAELTEIQRAWLVVAEDYAPYDVDITTRDPGADALQRTSPADTRFGVRVLITSGGPIYDHCHCGGLAYVGVFDRPGASAYQPAWVFTAGTTTDGVRLGQAVSHEAGHTLGLHHDGVTSTPGDNYYLGSALWAPIMGASYYSPVTQWSSGEYPLANNHEDDTAILGGVLGTRPDDRANGPTGAEPLPSTATSQRDGLIGTRSDVDAFTLTTDRRTTISVQPSGYQPDVDLSLQVAEAATGRVVATVDPASTAGDGVVADGLGADYTLPAGPARTYLITVDGVGNGNPAVTGHYSDYGSEGAYRLTVVPAGASQPLTADRPVVSLTGTVGQTWDAVSGSAFGASGGVPPYTWSASGLPPGAQLDRVSGRLLGALGAAGSWSGQVTVTDARGTSVVIDARFAVRPAGATSPAAAPPAPAWGRVAVRRARVGRAYRGMLTVVGGSGALRWTRAGALPPGIRLSVSRAGRQLVLRGRGHKRGHWRVRLHGTDAAGRSLIRTVRLTVQR